MLDIKSYTETKIDAKPANTKVAPKGTKISQKLDAFLAFFIASIIINTPNAIKITLTRSIIIILSPIGKFPVQFQQLTGK